MRHWILTVGRPFVVALALVSLFAIGCCQHPIERTGFRETIPEAMKSVVYVEDSTGSGSGIVVHPDGYILTCAHVVSDPSSVFVHINNAHLPAALIAKDDVLDLALLKLPVTKPLEDVVVWGDSSALREGDYVFAIGFPFGLAKTADMGIVSALDVVLGYPVITTDAAINPGHSGGGLYTAAGRLVGINNMIYRDSPFARTNIGLAFAIPGNTARAFVGRYLPQR